EDLQVDVGRALDQRRLREHIPERARVVVDGRLVGGSLDEVVVHAGVELKALAVTGHRDDGAVAVVVRASHALEPRVRERVAGGLDRIAGPQYSLALRLVRARARDPD